MSIKSALFVCVFLLAASVLYANRAAAADTEETLQPGSIQEIDLDQSPLGHGLDVLWQLFTPDGRRTRPFLKGVGSVKLAVYRTDNANDPEAAIDRLDAHFDNEGWATAFRVKDGKEQVWVLLRGRATRKEMVLVAINPEKLIQVKENQSVNRTVASLLDQSEQERDGDSRRDDQGRDDRRSDDSRWDDRNRSDSRWSRKPYWSWEKRTAAVNDIRPDGYDHIHARFNRVDGAYAGLRLQGTYDSIFGLTRYGEFGYAFGSKKPQYQAGGELFAFPNRDQLISVGFEIHDRTDTQDAWVIGEIENTIAAGLFREDYRDYYRRQGMSVYGSYNLDHHTQISVRYSRDRESSLANTVTWNWFDHRYAESSFRVNPAIDAGRFRSIRTDLTINTREKQGDYSTGWLATGFFEPAGKPFGGDYSFDRYSVDIRRYQTTGRLVAYDLRARAGASNGALPSQYLYDIGGVSTLRGYGYKAFTEDHMVLVNAECWIDDDAWGRQWPMNLASVGGFFDTGSAWFAHAPSSAPSTAVTLRPELRSSAGVGLKVSDLRVYFAKPLNGPSRRWEVSLRVNHTF